MADYVDRDKVLYYVEPDARPFLAERIRNIPAADVREVVTCAKCRYYSEKRKKCGHVNGLSELVFPTDYCSYGSVMREVSHDN